MLFRLSKLLSKQKHFHSFLRRENFYCTFLNRSVVYNQCKPKIQLRLERRFPKFAAAFFHSTPLRYVKSHQENENEYAHSVLSSMAPYSYSTLRYPLELKTSSQTSAISKEVEEFSKATEKALKDGLSLESVEFSPLVRSLANAFRYLSDDELIQVLHNLCLWPPTPKSYSPHFKLVWNTLDLECVHRMKSWTVDRKLLVADYWFYLKLNRISQYNRNLIFDMITNLRMLTNEQVVQLMFYINLQREIPASYLDRLQTRIVSVINQVTIDEIGVICLGYFKTKSRFQNFDVIQSIIYRFMHQIKQVHPMTVNSIFKLLKKSLFLGHIESYIPLLDKCVPYIKDWDVPTSIHLALLASECHVYRPLLLDTVTEKVMENIKEARTKDCVKLLQCLSHFNHHPNPKFHELLNEELKIQSCKDELDTYPRDLVFSNLFRAYLGYYDHSLIAPIFKADFIRMCITEFPETAYAFAEIDYSVGIECKDYTGLRLDEMDRKNMKSRRGNLINGEKSLNKTVQIIQEITQSLEKLSIPKDNILVRHILPHLYSPDIIVSLTPNSTLAEADKITPPQSILSPPSNEQWLCLVVMPFFAFAYHSKHVIGTMALKLRQLELIGYKLILIPYYEIPSSEILKQKYLKIKLESCNNINLKNNVKL